MIKPPKGMRIGQAIYNFTYWLEEHGIDIFYVKDEDFSYLYKQYLLSLETTKKK